MPRPWRPAPPTGTTGPIEREGIFNHFVGGYGDALRWIAEQSNRAAGMLGSTPSGQALRTILENAGTGLDESGQAFQDWGLGFSPMRGELAVPITDRPQMAAILGGVPPLAELGRAVPGAVRHAAKDFAESISPSMLDVYHGTRSRDSIIAHGFKPSPDGGIYFSSEPLEALKFGKMASGTGAVKVLKRDIDFENPLEIDLDGELFDPSITDRAIKEATEGGHDGVILRNIRNFEGGKMSDTYIALTPQR